LHTSELEGCTTTLRYCTQADLKKEEAAKAAFEEFFTDVYGIPVAAAKDYAAALVGQAFHDLESIQGLKPDELNDFFAKTGRHTMCQGYR